MESSSIKHWMRQLGCRKIKQRGQQVYSTCPDEHNHSRGVDRRPGFAVKIVPGDKSPAFCHSCKLAASFEWIVYEKTGDTSVFNYDGTKSGPDPMINASIWGTPKREVDNFFSERLIEPFKGSVPRYALDRGILIDTCRAWGLGHDKKHNRLIIPIRDDKSRLVGVCGRHTGDHIVKYSNYSLDTKLNELVPFIDDARYDDFISFQKSSWLCGEHMLTHGGEVVVVEGQLDAINVWQAGFDCVSIMGSWVSKKQVIRLTKIALKTKGLVLFFDGDKAGRECTEKVVEALGRDIPVRAVECPEGMDPGGMQKDQLKQLISS